jgi:hypothetical protein
LLLACDDLLIKELVERLQMYYTMCLNEQNIVSILNSIFNIPSCKKLKDNCIEYVCDNPLPFFTSNDFLLLDKCILYYLFKQDGFILSYNEEVIIWDSLIKWGINQTPKLEDNQDEWIDKNYEDLKNTLSIFIPFIKFHNITSEDFYDKVRPYKTIIPNNIYEEIMKYYLVEQPGMCIYNSKVIKPNFVNVIVNWITNKKESSESSMSIRTEDDPLYKFDLIYRGSRDGINNESFKKKCNCQLKSLVLIKIHESDKIFGGYSSIGFDFNQHYSSNSDSYTGFDITRFSEHYSSYSNRYTYSLDNFIFSFENDYNCKKSCVLNPYRAMCSSHNTGFNFGETLYMVDQVLYVSGGSYNYESNLCTESQTYNIEEIETYIVTYL